LRWVTRSKATFVGNEVRIVIRAGQRLEVSVRRFDDAEVGVGETRTGWFADPARRSTFRYEFRGIDESFDAVVDCVDEVVPLHMSRKD
jgi:hypothetical protein